MSYFLPELDYGESSEKDPAEEKAEKKKKKSVSFNLPDDDEEKKKKKSSTIAREEVVKAALAARKAALFDSICELSECVVQDNAELRRLTQGRADPLVCYTAQDFVQLCEERAASSGLCGLPTCAKPSRSSSASSSSQDPQNNIDNRHQQHQHQQQGPKYEISLREKRVYNAEVSTSFCSRKCAREAEAFSRTLGTAVEVDESGRCSVPTPQAVEKTAQVRQLERSVKGYDVSTGDEAVMKSRVKEKVKSKSKNKEIDKDKKASSVQVASSGFVKEGAPERESKACGAPVPTQSLKSGKVVMETAVKERDIRGGVNQSSTPRTSHAEMTEGGSGSDLQQQQQLEELQAKSDKPVIYFEIDAAKTGKDGKKGVQVGRLKVVGGEGGEIGTEEEEGMEKEGEGLEEDDADDDEGLGGMLQQSKGGNMPYNFGSLLPSSLLEKQEALRKAIIHANREEVLQMSNFGVGDDGGEGEGEYEDKYSDVDMEEVNAGAFELSLSSFGTVWNFFNCSVTGKLLTFLDKRYEEGVAVLGQQSDGNTPLDKEQAERTKLFSEQMSRVLPYIYQEVDISSTSRYFSNLQLKLRHCIRCLSFDSPMASMSFDEWCIVALALLAALAEQEVRELKLHLSSKKTSREMEELLLKCGMTKDEFNMILKVLLPLSE